MQELNLKSNPAPNGLPHYRPRFCSSSCQVPENDGASPANPYSGWAELCFWSSCFSFIFHKCFALRIPTVINTKRVLPGLYNQVRGDICPATAAAGFGLRDEDGIQMLMMTHRLCPPCKPTEESLLLLFSVQLVGIPTGSEWCRS